MLIVEESNLKATLVISFSPSSVLRNILPTEPASLKVRHSLGDSITTTDLSVCMGRWNESQDVPLMAVRPSCILYQSRSKEGQLGLNRHWNKTLTWIAYISPKKPKQNLLCHTSAVEDFCKYCRLDRIGSPSPRARALFDILDASLIAS